MGGGDLNFKKSWHPHTRANIEKVWIAEQKMLAEKSKTQQLQKELEEERAREELSRMAEDSGHRKREEKVEWMYAGAMGAADNRDEYLLGKPVDKTVLLNTKDDEDQMVSQVGQVQEHTAMNNVRDMAQKVRDDPMFAIKKKQQEQMRLLMAKSKVLDTVRKSKKEKKEKKEKKKSKKHKHHRHEGEDDTDEAEGSHRASTRPEGEHRHAHEHAPRADRRDTVGRGARDEPARGRDADSYRAERAHHERDDDRRGPSNRDGRGPARRYRSRSRSRSRSPPRRYRSPPRRYRSRSRSPPRRYRSRSPPRQRFADRRREGVSPPRHHDRPAPGPGPAPAPARTAPPKVDDQAERDAARLKAMMSNAEWHQKGRKERVDRYEQSLREEEAAALQPREVEDGTEGDGAKFIQEMSKTSWSSEATAHLGDRIRRHRHYIQSTSHSYDSGGLSKR